MKESSIRVLISYIVIIISYVLIIGFLLKNLNDVSGGNIGSSALLFGIASLAAGFLGGLIAPYSYETLIKYIAISLAVIVLIAAILFIIMGNAIGGIESWTVIIIAILFFVLLVGTVVVIVVTCLGLFAGALLGSLIGKSFTKDYEKREKEEDKKLASMPTFT